ncbi:MAG: hypothetical protein GY937_13830 [bacterium]|nr:hypothetical protein [bacterium]
MARSAGREPAAPTRSPGLAAGSPAWFALVFAAFSLICLFVYEPALEGPQVSDDRMYLASPYVQELSAENVKEILDPRSDITMMTANYAPFHLLAHGVQWKLFGERPLGYHVTNILLHALSATLLIALFLRSGLPIGAAFLGGAIFLLHPAGVEAVAWMSQLKTQLAMAAGLIALQLRTRPIASTTAFALALLAKAPAAVVLPVAAVWEWCQPSDPSLKRRSWSSLIAWSAVFLVFAALEMTAFLQAHTGVEQPTSEGAAPLWSSLAIMGRYLAMAVTSFGTSAFHEPSPVTTPWNPWVLAAIAVLLLLGTRTLFCLRERRLEAAWWLWAALSFLPVSQIFPFVYPMGDRYLYVMLPGLIGGSLLLGQSQAERIPADRRRPLALGLAGLTLLLVFAFASKSHQRAAIWTSDQRLIADSIRHYPMGNNAQFARAREAVHRGDIPAAVSELRKADSEGHLDFDDIYTDPVFVSILGDPRLQALLDQMARRQIEAYGQADRITEGGLIRLARAHLVLRQPEQALEAAARAQREGGRYVELAKDIERQAKALERSRH